MRNWEPWTTNTGKSNNHRILQQLVFHKQQTIQTTRVQDLDPRSCQTMTMSPWDDIYWTPWNPFPDTHLETFVFPKSHQVSFKRWNLDVPTPDLLGPAHQCSCNAFSYDNFGDHLQTCQTKSATCQVHVWVVYKLGTLLGSVGHRVKIHKITPVTGKERGDIEIKDYVGM